MQHPVDVVEDVVLAHLRPELLPVDGKDLIGDVVDATIAVLVNLPGRGRKEPIVCRDLLVGPAGEELGSVPGTGHGYQIWDILHAQSRERGISTRRCDKNPHVLMLRRRENLLQLVHHVVERPVEVDVLLGEWPVRPEVDAILLELVDASPAGIGKKSPAPTDLGRIIVDVVTHRLCVVVLDHPAHVPADRCATEAVAPGITVGLQSCREQLKDRAHGFFLALGPQRWERVEDGIALVDPVTGLVRDDRAPRHRRQGGLVNVGELLLTRLVVGHTVVVQLASRDTGLFGGDEDRHPGSGTKSEDSTALPLTRIPRRAGIAAQVVHPDLGELVHQGLADAVGGVAVHPAIVGDEGHHSLLADSIARPPEGANVGVVEAVLVRGRGTSGVGLPDPGVQGRIVQVRVVVIGAGLAGRVRRIADDHLDRSRQLPLDALIVRRDQRGVGPIPLLGDLEGVGERGTREGRVPGARSLLRGPPLGLLPYPGLLGLRLLGVGGPGLESLGSGRGIGVRRQTRCALLVRNLVHPGLGEGLVRRLDIDACNVVGQQHDLVGPQLPVILARHVLGPDDPRFEQPHDERPGAGERVAQPVTMDTRPQCGAVPSDSVITGYDLGICSSTADCRLAC